MEGWKDNDIQTNRHSMKQLSCLEIWTFSYKRQRGSKKGINGCMDG